MFCQIEKWHSSVDSASIHHKMQVSWLEPEETEKTQEQKQQTHIILHCHIHAFHSLSTYDKQDYTIVPGLESMKKESFRIYCVDFPFLTYPKTIYCPIISIQDGPWNYVAQENFTAAHWMRTMLHRLGYLKACSPVGGTMWGFCGDHRRCSPAALACHCGQALNL